MRPILPLFLLLGASTAAFAQPVRPIDLTYLDGSVIVAGENGEIVALDAATGTVQRRRTIDGQPTAIKVIDGEIWVADAKAGLLRALDKNGLGDTSRTTKTLLSISDFAIDGDDFYAAGKWARRVMRGRVSDGAGEGSLRWQTDLDFCPGQVRLLEQEDILCVLDAFGNQFCLLDATDGHVIKQFAFYGHRLRGLLDDPDGKRLVVSHQMLNPTSQTTSNDIHWGMMMSNDVRWLDREALLNAEGDGIYRGGRIDPIGFVGNGGADPNDLAITRDGIVLVPLGGTDEVAIALESDFEFDRLPIGQNPVAVCLSADQRHAWIACKLDDTIWKIDVAARRVVSHVRLSEPAAKSLAERGERLFHSGQMAHDQWMTCSSCHPGGHAINDRSDNLGDGDFGAPKRILSLLGRSETPPFGWLGKDATLHDQIGRSIRSTMRGPEIKDASLSDSYEYNKEGKSVEGSYAYNDGLSDEMVAALAAFVRSLPAPPSIDSQRGTTDQEAIDRGRALFAAEGCADCHRSSTYTAPELFEVGLEDELGRRAFNPPSLIGVGQRGPRYFHDLRAGSLAEVFTEHQHQLTRALSERELADLLAFLRSL